MEPLFNRGGSDEPEFDFQPGPRRSAQEVARRCIVLCCIAASPQFPRGEFDAWLRNEGLWEELSPKEVETLTAQVPTKRQNIDASWRSEALQVMLWSIRKLELLPPITEIAKISRILDVMPAFGKPTSDFISSASLRSNEEIDAELEKTVSAHWQIRNERGHPEQKREPMIDGVVVERHWALEWIVNYDDEPWDQVPLTT
jgi:hypothetical protein